MRNEDTDEEVACPICGVVNDMCAHIVAHIDCTFSETHAGEFYARETEFRTIVEEAFLPRLQKGVKMDWGGEILNGLWSEAVASYSAEYDDFTLEGYYFYQLIGELFFEAGAIEPDGYIIDDGPPGMSSAMSLYYSEDPKQIVDDAYSRLVGMLKRQ